jgi:hypothetical protein
VLDLTLNNTGGKTASASDSAELSKDSQMVDKDELLAKVDASSSDSLLDSTDSSAATLEAELISPDRPPDLLITTGSSELATVTTASNFMEPEALNLNDLDESKEASATTITTTQPVIKATLPANTMIRVVIHSDTVIDETVQTNAAGEMVLDVASLGQNLEPGEHTASYTYIDPVTGEEVTKTYNFTVDPKAPRQLAVAITPKVTTTPSPSVIRSPTPVPSIPYGSGNPYSPSISASPAATKSAVISTRSAVVSTSSGQYNSGSTGTTIALLLGGLFFVLAGTWSYFLATSFEAKNDS